MKNNIPVILDAKFIRGATKLKFVPDSSAPEIAIAGKSNVGKSSLLRILLNNRKLVRVSQKPGRTREINFFKVRAKEITPFVLADLPGYGYASVPLSMRKEWGVFISEYLENRLTLKLVILLMDARRDITEEELSFVHWLESKSINWLLVITKIDKIPKPKWINVTSKFKKGFNLKKDPVLFSATKNIGLDNLWKWIRKTTLKKEHSFPE